MRTGRHTISRECELHFWVGVQPLGCPLCVQGRFYAQRGKLKLELQRSSRNPRYASLSRTSLGRGASGFTLVEVLLALALAVILMASIYTALDIYRQVSSSGREDVDRSQLARALQRKITVDVRSVIFTPPKQQDQGGEEMQAADEGEEIVNEIEIIDPSDAIASTAKGVVGDAESLVLHISKPPRGLNYTTPDTAAGRSVTARNSDLVSVTYLLASPDGGPLHQAAYAQAGKSGLARLEGDRLVMDTADAGGDVAELARTTHLLAEEVVSLQFRYFDGVEWLNAWDSTQSEKLPRAIEVMIGLRSKLSAEDATPQLYRFVIAVPLADPAPPELELLESGQ